MIHCWHVISRKYILLPRYVCTAQGKNQSFSSQTCKNDFNSFSICSHSHLFPEHCARYHLWPAGPTQPHISQISLTSCKPSPGVTGAEGQWLITNQLHALLRRFKSVTQHHLAVDISWLLCNSLPNLPRVSFFVLDFRWDLNTYLRVWSGCAGFQRWGSLPSVLPSPVWFTCSGNWYRGPVASTDHCLMLYNHVTVALHLCEWNSAARLNRLACVKCHINAAKLLSGLKITPVGDCNILHVQFSSLKS